MVKFKWKRSEQSKSPFIYKWAFECFGRELEFGLSQGELFVFKDVGRSILRTPTKLAAQLRMLRTRLNDERQKSKHERGKTQQPKRNTEKETSR